MRSWSAMAMTSSVPWAATSSRISMTLDVPSDARVWMWRSARPSRSVTLALPPGGRRDRARSGGRPPTTGPARPRRTARTPGPPHRGTPRRVHAGSRRSQVDFDLQITVMASTLYRLMADRIGREYDKAQAKTIFRNLLDVSATVQIGETGVVVTLDKRAHNPYLVASGLADEPTPMPWFGNKPLVIRFD